jgi:starch synthase (maltosyl-transferring)
VQPPALIRTRQPPPRVVIEGVTPEIDAGRFAAKRTVGERFAVSADVFTDGHDALAADLLWRRESDGEWTAVPMRELGNDRWSSSFTPTEAGCYLYSVTAWIDGFETWRRDTAKKHAAGLDVQVESVAGLDLVRQAAKVAAREADAAVIEAALTELEAGAVEGVLDDQPLRDAMRRCAERTAAVEYERQLRLEVDRERARFSTWYELFPRSCADEPGRHGTLADCRRRLDYVAELGFDVLYLPPIHPIGVTNRKGRNNSLTAAPGDPGSPWAIGAATGGHDAIHPELGDAEDLRALVEAAHDRGIEVALDLAFQCSPDHPWVTEHPEWFRHRPDGSIQYAENPPKKYEDIYPIDFTGKDWKQLWAALHGVVEHWIGHGIRIFRVDNPHTKPFRFWEWLIAEVKREHPDVLFLAEAFTRPRVMYQLAKAGFSQSYTYFAWRQTKHELIDYLTELSDTEVADFFRPNLWPNTPDILTEQLQIGTRSVFLSRLVLAATLAANYGIYGPAYELTEHVARPGSEEYLDNEKYEIRVWDTARLDRPDSLRHVIARINGIRKRHPALQHDRTVHFHPTDNEQLVCWSKTERRADEDDPGDVMVMVVNLDPHHVHAGWIDLDLDVLGLDEDATFQVHDELGGARYLWRGRRNYVQLDPSSMPAHVMAVRKHVRTEQDFDYFM